MSTKTLASLLVLTVVATVPAAIRKGSIKHTSRFERILQRHDRKGELRAALLGITPLEFRDLQNRHTADEIVRSFGFKNEMGFRQALLGKIRDELHHRGWSNSKIDHFMLSHEQTS